MFKKNDRGYSYATLCGCALLQRRVNLFNEAMVPAQFFHATLTGFEITHFSQEEARTNSRKLVDVYPLEKRGLLFMGPPGVGKTHLAAAMIKILTLDKGYFCKFIDFFSLLASLREGYARGKSDSEITTPFINAPVLVIDELGKGRNNEWELNILDQIISKRYNNSHDTTTIITTNYTVRKELTAPFAGAVPRGKKSSVSTDSKEFAEEIFGETLPERVGNRIFSRLLEMCKMIEMDGEDYRVLKNIKSSG